jgi:hypothetical protein
MGNQLAGQLIPHKSVLSGLVVRVWRLHHPFVEEKQEQAAAAAAAEEEGHDEVVIVLRYVLVRGLEEVSQSVSQLTVSQSLHTPCLLPEQ